MGCPYAWVWQRRRLLHVRAPVSSCVRQACTDESSGNIDMTAVFPFLGSTELEVLAVVGSFLLLLTHAITAFCTKERVVVSSKCVRSPPAVFGSSADHYPEDDQVRVSRGNCGKSGTMCSPFRPSSDKSYVVSHGTVSRD